MRRLTALILPDARMNVASDQQQGVGPNESNSTGPSVPVARDAESQQNDKKKADRGLPRSRALINFEIVSCVCAVLALVGLLVQIRSDAQAQRVAATLDYVNQFNSDPISGHRLNIERAWLPMRDQLRQVNGSGGLPASAIEKTVSTVVSDYDAAQRDRPVSLSILELASFYDRAILCVDVGSCDEDIFDQYFKEQIVVFWNMYGPMIIDSRTFSTPTLGSLTENFSKGNAR